MRMMEDDGLGLQPSRPFREIEIMRLALNFERIDPTRGGAETYIVDLCRSLISAANSILEHIAGIDDFEVAEATYRSAVARWPRARIRLRQGARVVMKSWTGE